MAKLFKVTVATSGRKEVNVVAESAEEAQAKVVLAEGESVVSNEEVGEVVA